VSVTVQEGDSAVIARTSEVIVESGDPALEAVAEQLRDLLGYWVRRTPPSTGPDSAPAFRTLPADSVAVDVRLALAEGDWGLGLEGYELVVNGDGITIRGILDRMEEIDGRLVITDYKSGKAPPERYALPAFFALKIYALLIRRRTGRTPDAIRLIYLNGPTVYEIPVNDAQLEAMDRQLRALWSAIDKAIAADSFPPRPGRLCDWCSFQDQCPAFAGASGTDEDEAAAVG
jgi:RecB family exonuclease